VLLPLSQAPAEVFFWISRELQLAVRTSGDAKALAADVRRAVSSVDPGIPIGAARTLEERIDAAFSRERMIAQLLTILGAAGLAIALLGLAAAVDYQVRRQRRDTAIRLALGASVSGVVRPLVASGTVLAVAGAVAGSVASLGIGPLLASLLFAIRPNDPLTLSAVALAVVGISIITAWAIARTAARVDPAELLRS
jgi:ABC-type antimicrobial peptide transport system permease subunit